MSRRLFLPALVMGALLLFITYHFLSGEESPAPPAVVEGGPLVRLAPHLRGLEDSRDGEISARTYVDAAMESVVGSPRPVILEALEHADWGAQWAGLLAVPRYGPADATLTRALAPRLDSESVRVRRLAATAVAFLGADFAEVEPALERAARDTEPTVRADALATLARRTERAHELWPLFAESLKDEHGPVRAAAAKGLARIELREKLPPRQVAELRGSLRSAMQDEVHDVRMYAVMALGRAGAQAADDVPAMVALLNEESSLVRGTAATAIGDVGAAALPHIEAALASAGPEQVGSLLWSMKLIGAPALPVMRRMLEHASTVVRVQTALKLWEMDQPAGASAAVLAKALGDDDLGAVRLAARGLARMGTAGAEAKAALEAQRDHEDEVVRAAVRSALARMSAEAGKGQK